MEKIKNKSNQTEMLYKLFEDLLIENSNIIGINFFDYIINIDEMKTVIKTPEFYIIFEDENMQKFAIKVSTLNDSIFAKRINFDEIGCYEFYESEIQFTPEKIYTTELGTNVIFETKSKYFSINYDSIEEDEVIEIEIIKKSYPNFLKLKAFLQSFKDYNLHTIFSSTLWKPSDSDRILTTKVSFELRNENDVIFVNTDFKDNDFEVQVSNKCLLENANILSLVPTKTEEIEFTEESINIKTTFCNVEIGVNCVYDDCLEIILSVE